MNLKEKIDNYINYISIYLSQNTKQFYKEKLLRFYDFTKNYEIVTEENIKNIFENYILKLKQKNKNNSINKYIVSFNNLMKYHNMNIHIKKLKNDSKQFEAFTDLEIKKILSSLDKLNLENRLIIKLLFDTGIRISELININRNNIDFNNKRILLTVTKTKKPRYVYFSKLTEEDLYNYFKVSNTEAIGDSLFNFTYSKVIIFFKKLKNKLNINKMTVHMFRHTYATKLLRTGLDIFAVSLLLGHASIKTTQKYLHYNNDDLKEFYFENRDKIYEIK